MMCSSWEVNEFKSRLAITKIAIVIIGIIVIIAIAGAAFYYLMLPYPSPTPSPTPKPTTTPPSTPTATPTPTSSPTPTYTPTPPPSPSVKPIINLRVGAYAEYIQMVYTDEGTMEMQIKYSVDGEETYNGVNCWVLSLTSTMEQQSMKMKTMLTWWMAKSDSHAVHGRIQTYLNDNLMYEQEFDPKNAPQQAGEPPKPIDVSHTVGYETITVPAGTFANCIKSRIEVTTKGVVSYSWVHPNVPIWGIVKSEIYEDSEKTMTMELISYGG